MKRVKYHLNGRETKLSPTKAHIYWKIPIISNSTINLYYNSEKKLSKLQIDTGNVFYYSQVGNNGNI